MGKTYRKDEGRRPKWDKRGKKSHKLREIEEEKFKPRPHQYPSPYPEPPEIEDFS